jgi:hypothetical protein
MAAALRGFLHEHAPSYTRATLGRFLRKLFDKEIERELRLLEEYVVGKPERDVGINLIADALGPRAPYTQFTPALPGARLDLSGPATITQAPKFVEKDPSWIHQVDTQIIRKTKKPDPDPEIHGSDTQIIRRKR